GLIGHAPVEAAILDHDVGRDMASSRDLFPCQTGGRAADLAGLLWRVLQPVALSAVLQDEPLLIDGVPEGLAQSVGDGDQLRHRFPQVMACWAARRERPVSAARRAISRNLSGPLARAALRPAIRWRCFDRSAMGNIE